jgi:hypothetical protein
VEASVFPELARPPNRARFCAAVAASGNDVALSLNGAPAVAVTSDDPVPGHFTHLNVGGRWGGVHQSEAFTGRIVVFPERKTDAALRALSDLATWTTDLSGLDGVDGLDRFDENGEALRLAPETYR